MTDSACERCREGSQRMALRCGAKSPPGKAVAEVWSTCAHLRAFPAGLLDLPDPPQALYGCGSREILNRLVGGAAAVTIVGSRRPSSSGGDLAHGIARGLAEVGVVVVSGLAAGIDGAAHRGALEGGGPTVAVMGGGPDVAYPARHRALHERLVAGEGLVVAELPAGTRPTRWTFPARNRIMAALASVTVIVEARERSGSLITAGFAAELGREVGAVPGQVGHANSVGTNALLKDGAHVVRGPDDVLDILEGGGRLILRRPSVPTGPRLSRGLQAVLEAVEEEPGSADSIAARQGLPGLEVAVSLARLELLGYVACGDDGRFRRTAVAAPA